MTSMQTVVVEYATASAGQTYRPAISMKYTLTVVFSGATPAVAAKDERPAITTALSRTEACIFPRVYTRRADSCWRMASMRRCCCSAVSRTVATITARKSSQCISRCRYSLDGVVAHQCDVRGPARHPLSRCYHRDTEVWLGIGRGVCGFGPACGHARHRKWLASVRRECPSRGGTTHGDKLCHLFVPLTSLPEALLNGMAMTLLIVYRPQWVSTFNDERYTKGQ